jgi:hypothetical protein
VLVAALDLGVTLERLEALGDKAGPVALMLLLGFKAGLPVLLHHGQALARVAAVQLGPGGVSLFHERSRLEFLDGPGVAWCGELHLETPAVDTRLADDKFDGATGEGRALRVKLF